MQLTTSQRQLTGRTKRNPSCVRPGGFVRAPVRVQAFKWQLPSRKEGAGKAKAVSVVPAAAEDGTTATPAAAAAVTPVARPRVVVLGSGWAAMSMIKALPKNISDKYEIVVVSPRNHFVYTPLLPAVAVGTVEERSIVEPVRSLVHGKGTYYEACCRSIDPHAKEIVACFPEDAGQEEACFTLQYDLLVVGVGSVNNTFGIPGVAEHCQFLKSIEDAHTLRRRISECFERAALPHTSEAERKRLLTFVVCGGGPTGVEVAAEMNDMISSDLKAYYPQLMAHVHIKVIEMTDHLLSTYDHKIGDFAAQQFNRAGVELVLHTQVASVREGVVTVADKASQEKYDIPFGACVWATGIAMSPLVKQLQQLLPGEQSHSRCVATDEFLRVAGTSGSIYALGDASTLNQHRALEHADELFEQADLDKDGLMSLRDLRQLLHTASKEYPHLEEHARFLDAKCSRFGGLIRQVLHATGHDSAIDGLTNSSMLTREQFKAVLAQVDSGLRALPATAQVAKQHGEFMAELLTRGRWEPATGQLALHRRQSPFAYFHKGSLAYVGDDRAVVDVPLGSGVQLMGVEAGVMWRGYETIAQISPRNSVLVAANWLRTKMFGRDMSVMP